MLLKASVASSRRFQRRSADAGAASPRLCSARHDGKFVAVLRTILLVLAYLLAAHVKPARRRLIGWWKALSPAGMLVVMVEPAKPRGHAGNLRLSDGQSAALAIEAGLP